MTAMTEQWLFMTLFHYNRRDNNVNVTSNQTSNERRDGMSQQWPFNNSQLMASAANRVYGGSPMAGVACE